MVDGDRAGSSDGRRSRPGFDNGSDTGEIGGVEHLPARLSAFFRRRALLTILSAAVMLIAAMAGSWICAPFALAFAVFAYLWGMEAATPNREDAEGCAGCAAGCVGCHEHIDSAAHGGR
jgi:hypothetical protein